ncbi:MAG: M1 family metallopeptidase [Desulfobacterales bacterium]
MQQLQDSVYPETYNITIEPDLNRLDFSGELVLSLKTGSQVTGVTLNIAELAIMRCECRLAGNWTSCGFSVNPDFETLDIHLPEPAEAGLEIRICYYGRINEKMAGFYKSTVKTSRGIETIAVTQFQESDARRAFPCIDQPGAKARFELSLVTDREMTPVSNMPVESETSLQEGKRKVKFQQTPLMSTYLLFFGVGRFGLATDELDRRIRAVVAEGMENGIHYSLAFARKALHYCENYFSFPYPLPKMDLIAVPDFAFGAMENWGAITFRENLLRYDPQYTSVDGEERICEVIAHEIVHQWFGNLVTPQDWKYLWLNESFATFFGYTIVDFFNGDWQVWHEFLESQTAPAMSRDGLTDTTSIEIPGGSHVVINSSTAPVIYSKGGSILRQIKDYLGDEKFRASLCRFLDTHSYGRAASNDLWAAMEAESGMPVQKIMNQWITLAGHPLVYAERKQNTLLLSQQRFTYLPAASGEGNVWPIPASIRMYRSNGESFEKTLLFDSAETEVELDDDVEAYKINDRQSGFFRVWYADAENLKRLKKMTKDRALPETDRWGLEGDLYALAVSGRIHISTYLDHLSWCETESEPLPISGKMSNLHHLMLATRGKARKTVSACAASHLTAALNRVGHDPEPGEPHGVSRLRNLLLWQASIFDISGTTEAALSRFEELAAGRDVHPDIMRGAMQAGAWAGDEKTFEWFTRRMETSASEHDRINCLRAMGCFSEPAVIEKALSYILQKVPERNKFIPVAQMASNPAAVPFLWDWYKESESALESLHPIIHERIIAAVLPLPGLEKPDEAAAHFEKYLEKSPPAADTVRMSLEKLEINHRLRTRADSY